ncbi:interferon-induced protein 44-like [Heptranchias perlo]|uniref:interferon-induced protein 44-like n=1 Tax=Heptranchias perlo TaxID=212740 RepID=UPI00355A4117
MSVISSRLTTENQKQLSQLLGKVNLHLLYKASVHGFSARSFHAKCEQQGPTLTVGYNKLGLIFGGYTSKDFASYGSNMDNKAFLFRLITNKADGKPLKFPVKQDALAIGEISECGPNFGESLVFLSDGKRIKGEPGSSYSFQKNDLFGNNLDLVECEVYRVEALKAPWRNITWTTKKRQELIDVIKSYKPYGTSVSKAHILLIGPTGGGKTSFINSSNSVFRGHVTSRCLVGSRATSTTTMYSTYSFRGDKEGTALPLILCDTMGLEEGAESGINSDDIISIIKGHVPNKYQFNTTSPIKEDTKGYIESASAGAKIHCVVYVIDANKATILSYQMEKKICAIRSQINQLEIPQIVLLTKVDKECPLVGKDVENVYRSEHIEKKVLEVGEKLGIPVSCIVPVKNYWSDLELDCSTDILILSALLQMIRYADDYFENLDNSSANC